jgi:hypothetical protein
MKILRSAQYSDRVILTVDDITKVLNGEEIGAEHALKTSTESCTVREKVSAVITWLEENSIFVKKE